MLGVLKIIFYICISELTISLKRPIQKTHIKPTTLAKMCFLGRFQVKIL